MKLWLILITIILMTLKVAQVGLAADMSWWLVFAPLWGPIAIGVALVLLAGYRLGVLSRRQK